MAGHSSVLVGSQRGQPWPRGTGLPVARPAPVTLPWGGFVSPPPAATGSSPCARGRWGPRVCRAAGVRLATGRTGTRRSCRGELSPPAGHRHSAVTTGASDGCCLLGSQEAAASPGHRLWPHFIQLHVSKSTRRCTPALQPGVCGGAGRCQR